MQVISARALRTALVAATPGKQKILFFAGQGCGFFQKERHLSSWHDDFHFVPLTDGRMEQQVEGLHVPTCPPINSEVVCGHSAGATKALHFAIQNPSVKTVILLCPAPLPGMRIPMYLQLRITRKAFKYLPPILREKEFMLDDHDTRDLMLNELPGGTILHLAKTMGPWQGSVVREMMVSGFKGLLRRNRPNWRKLLQGKNIIVLAADKDRMIRPEFARKVAQTLSADHFDWIHGSGHMCMFQNQSKDLLAKILDLAGVRHA